MPFSFDLNVPFLPGTVGQIDLKSKAEKILKKLVSTFKPERSNVYIDTESKYLLLKDSNGEVRNLSAFFGGESVGALSNDRVERESSAGRSGETKAETVEAAKPSAAEPMDPATWAILWSCTESLTGLKQCQESEPLASKQKKSLSKLSRYQENKGLFGSNTLKLKRSQDLMYNNIYERLSEIDKELDSETRNTSLKNKRALENERHQLIMMALKIELPIAAVSALENFESPCPETIIVFKDKNGDIKKDLRSLHEDVRDLISQFQQQGDVSGVKNIQIELKKLIEELSSASQIELSDKDKKLVLDHLLALKERVDLIEAFHSTAESLGEMLAVAKKLGAPVTLRNLFQDIAQAMPLTPTLLASGKVEEAKLGLLTVAAIACAIRNGEADGLYRPRNLAHQQVKIELEIPRLEREALARFVGKLSDDRKTVLGPVNEDTHAKVRASLRYKEKLELEERLKVARQLAEKRNAYFSTLQEIDDRLGDKKKSRYHMVVWAQPGDNRAEEIYGRVLSRAKASPEVALLAARLFMLQRDVVKLEQHFFGTGPNALAAEVDSGAAKEVKNEAISQKIQTLFAAAGLSEKDLEKLYSDWRDRDISENLMRLSMNYASVRQVQADKAAFAVGANVLMRDVGVQRGLTALGGSQNATVLLAQRNVLAGLAALSPEASSGALTPDSEAVVDRARAIAHEVGKIVQEVNDERLETSEEVYINLRDELLRLIQKRGQIAHDAIRQRQELREARDDFDVSPDRRGRTELAHNIIEAVRWDREVRTLFMKYGLVPEDAAEPELEGIPQQDRKKIMDAVSRREAHRQKLAGLDTRKMRKRRLSNELPSMAALTALEPFASKYYFLHKGARVEMERLDRQIEDYVEALQDIANTRRDWLADAMGTVDKLIASAILMCCPGDLSRRVENGAVLDAYELAFHRQQIVALLEHWGLNVGAFGVEIDLALMKRFSLGQVVATASQAVDPDTKLVVDPVRRSAVEKLMDRAKFKFGEIIRPETVKDVAGWVVHKKRLRREVTDSLMRATAALQPGESIKCMAGVAIETSSPKIPLDPLSISTLQTTLTNRGFTGFMIERDEEGYAIRMYTGVGSRLGATVEAGAPLPQNDHFKASVGVVATGHSDVDAGFSLRFRTGDDLGKFLLAFANGKVIPTEVLESLSDRGRTFGLTVGGGLTAFGVAQARRLQSLNSGSDNRLAGGSEDPHYEAAGENVAGPLFLIMDVLALAQKTEARVTTGKDKWTLELGGNLTASMSAQASLTALAPTSGGVVHNAMVAGTGLQKEFDEATGRRIQNADGTTKVEGSYDISQATETPARDMVLLKASDQANWNWTSRLVCGQDRKLQDGWLVLETTATRTADLAIIGILGNDFKERLKKEQKLAEDYRALVKSIPEGQRIRVVTRLKPQQRESINALLDALDTAETDMEAYVFRAKVLAMLSNRDNYDVLEIEAVGSSGASNTRTLFSAPLAKLRLDGSAMLEGVRTRLTVPQTGGARG